VVDFNGILSPEMLDVAFREWNNQSQDDA